jgi:hypothetical protein
MRNRDHCSAAIHDRGYDRVRKTQHAEAPHISFAIESVRADATFGEPSGPVHASAHCRREQIAVASSFTLVPGRCRLELIGSIRLEW